MIIIPIIFSTNPYVDDAPPMSKKELIIVTSVFSFFCVIFLAAIAWILYDQHQVSKFWKEQDQLSRECFKKPTDTCYQDLDRRMKEYFCQHHKMC